MTKQKMAAVKRAVKDVLKARADYRNNGMLARYRAAAANEDLLLREGVRVGEKEVTLGGDVIFTIQRRFGKRKVDGCYPELTPVLVPVTAQ